MKKTYIHTQVPLTTKERLIALSILRERNMTETLKDIINEAYKREIGGKNETA